eukprot:555284-Prymnesium_polylepis.2
MCGKRRQLPSRPVAAAACPAGSEGGGAVRALLRRRPPLRDAPGGLPAQQRRDLPVRYRRLGVRDRRAAARRRVPPGRSPPGPGSVRRSGVWCGGWRGGCHAASGVMWATGKEAPAQMHECVWRACGVYTTLTLPLRICFCRSVKAATDSFWEMSARFKGVQPATVQACMRPCQPDAMPSMGAIPGISGAYMSAGHNWCATCRTRAACARLPPRCASLEPPIARDHRASPFGRRVSCRSWGILWAPVSGKAMSELILDGEASCVDLAAFDPARFMPTKTRRGRKRGEVAVGEQW